ncbi:MAG: DUF6641 family protein [Aquiluna sp.]
MHPVTIFLFYFSDLATPKQLAKLFISENKNLLKTGGFHEVSTECPEGLAGYQPFLVAQSWGSAITCVCSSTTLERRTLMSTLSSLKLVTARKPSKPSGLVQRRHKLSNKLWEQLAQAQAAGESYAPTRQRVIKDPETGLRREVTVPKRIRPWWFVAENGKVCLSVKYGSRVMELAKGKSAVEVAGPQELIKTLEALKAAVEAGELDAAIDTASQSLREGFSK